MWDGWCNIILFPTYCYFAQVAVSENHLGQNFYQKETDLATDVLRETIQWLTFRNDNKKETKRNEYGVLRSGQQTAASRRIQCINNRCFCKHKEIDQLYYREPFEEVLKSVLCFRSYHLAAPLAPSTSPNGMRILHFFFWKSPKHVSKWILGLLPSLQMKHFTILC